MPSKVKQVVGVSTLSYTQQPLHLYARVCGILERTINDNASLGSITWYTSSLDRDDGCWNDV